jgi:conjugal transfer/entry exclusion protein
MTLRIVVRVLSMLCLAAGLSTVTANAQLVGPIPVHDPINGITLIDQKLNQLTQIKNQLQQLRYELQNLKQYSLDWSGILSQVESIRSQVAANAPTIANANTQLGQMRNEILELQQLEAMSNSAQGSMQLGQTTNSLVAALIVQVQKQRALTINSIQQEQRDRAAAFAILYGPSQLAK